MIAKGTPHANGARLGAYMVTGKDGETATLHELRGFAEDDIVSAFRSVHVMAGATRCDQPFFHCQVRNPKGEHLSREQWQHAADRIEAKLGLSGQGRAIAFHSKDGDEHMHVAWSRIDGNLKAKPLPFYKLRLKEVCRQLEQEFGLTPVRNQREAAEPRAPSRAERDQATRLGVDIEAVRGAIRDAWQHSDNGASFRRALDERGLQLAQGDKRDYVVIDQQGGLHALGKRVLGVSAAETRKRLGDLAPGLLLTVEAVREQLAAQNLEQPMQEPGQATAPEPAARQAETEIPGSNGKPAPRPRSKGEQDEEARRHAATCSDNGGMVAQNAEANRRFLELNPFLKQEFGKAGRSLGHSGERPAAADRAELDVPKPQGREAQTADDKQQRIDELARQIEERWNQARSPDLGRDR